MNFLLIILIFFDLILTKNSHINELMVEIIQYLYTHVSVWDLRKGHESIESQLYFREDFNEQFEITRIIIQQPIRSFQTCESSLQNFEKAPWGLHCISVLKTKQKNDSDLWETLMSNLTSWTKYFSSIKE